MQWVDLTSVRENCFIRTRVPSVSPVTVEFKAAHDELNPSITEQIKLLLMSDLDTLI